MVRTGRRHRGTGAEDAQRDRGTYAQRWHMYSGTSLMRRGFCTEAHVHRQRCTHVLSRPHRQRRLQCESHLHMENVTHTVRSEACRYRGRGVPDACKKCKSA